MSRENLIELMFFLLFSARPNYNHLNREELLYELDMALQHNQELNEQLQGKVYS
jgi:hypothetical protein